MNHEKYAQRHSVKIEQFEALIAQANKKSKNTYTITGYLFLVFFVCFAYFGVYKENFMVSGILMGAGVAIVFLLALIRKFKSRPEMAIYNHLLTDFINSELNSEIELSKITAYKSRVNFSNRSAFEMHFRVNPSLKTFMNERHLRVAPFEYVYENSREDMRRVNGFIFETDLKKRVNEPVYIKSVNAFGLIPCSLPKRLNKIDLVDPELKDLFHAYSLSQNKSHSVVNPDDFEKLKALSKKEDRNFEYLLSGSKIYGIMSSEFHFFDVIDYRASFEHDTSFMAYLNSIQPTINRLIDICEAAEYSSSSHTN